MNFSVDTGEFIKFKTLWLRFDHVVVGRVSEAQCWDFRGSCIEDSVFLHFFPDSEFIEADWTFRGYFLSSVRQLANDLKRMRLNFPFLKRYELTQRVADIVIRTIPPQ